MLAESFSSNRCSWSTSNGNAEWERLSRKERIIEPFILQFDKRCDLFVRKVSGTCIFFCKNVRFTIHLLTTNQVIFSEVSVGVCCVSLATNHDVRQAGNKIKARILMWRIYKRFLREHLVIKMRPWSYTLRYAQISRFPSHGRARSIALNNQHQALKFSTDSYLKRKASFSAA